MHFFSKISDQYQELWRAIIRPPRDFYERGDLGPKVFAIKSKLYSRRDFELRNSRNLKIQCSHFSPFEECESLDRRPCVIYLHGNSSSRLEALNCLPVLLPQGISVVAFDFTGSGLSDGEYVSLGWWERDDLADVIAHLRSTKRASCIGLWGRSMGAVTALLHVHRDPSIAGMILDSPFSSLRKLAEELSENYFAMRIPKFLIASALNMLRITILGKAHFDIDKLNPIDYAAQSFVPALFVVAKEDHFIIPKHGQEIHDRYAGDKNIVMVEGDHNSARPSFLNKSAAIFFWNTMQREDEILLNSRKISKSKAESARMGGTHRLWPVNELFLDATYQGEAAAASDDGLRPRSDDKSLKIFSCREVPAKITEHHCSQSASVGRSFRECCEAYPTPLLSANSEQLPFIANLKIPSDVWEDISFTEESSREDFSGAEEGGSGDDHPSLSNMRAEKPSNLSNSLKSNQLPHSTHFKIGEIMKAPTRVFVFEEYPLTPKNNMNSLGYHGE